MKNVFLGEYIKQRRLDLGLTQEQLCDGICEPMTLSRLENGKQTPSRNRINALLQRLGLPDDRYFALLSKNELEMEALQKEIVACNANHRVEEGFETLTTICPLTAPSAAMHPAISRACSRGTTAFFRS
jgi:transcriptional regulator with XRE-family HTH domain